MKFDEYKLKFGRFHRRYMQFTYGAVGLYEWGNQFHFKYTIGQGYFWGAMNFNVPAQFASFMLDELMQMVFNPNGPDCANNMRGIYVGTAFMLVLLKLEDFEALMWARYVTRTAGPLIMTVYRTTSPRSESAAKVVFKNAIGLAMGAVFWHIPYIFDLLRLNEDDHEPFMCSLSLHMSVFKFFASVPFAVYNNIDSPFHNSRALVVLPWLLFDFPAMVMMLRNCPWDNSLIYGVDRTPNTYRVFPLGLAGAAHVWMQAIIPFVAYDLYHKCCVRRLIVDDTPASAPKA